MSISFRPTKEVSDAISKIRLDRGGISISDAIRVAVLECASGKPQLAITPSMAPPKDFAAFKKALETFSEDLLYVAETGLPKSRQDTSPEDLPLIEKARAKFHATYAKIDAIVQRVELFSRLVAALSVCDIRVLRNAVTQLQRQNDAHAQRATDQKQPTELRNKSEVWVRELSGPILAVFRAVGISPNSPAPKTNSTNGKGKA